jgi:sarcosine oxidase subunit gamma
MAVCSVLARKGAEAALVDRVRQTLNLELPRRPRFATVDTTTFVWGGPSQWLALRENDSGQPFETNLRSALQDLASVMDQSDGRIIIRIGGPRARDALAKGVLIDLHPNAFQPGDVAITTIAHLDVHLWQLDDAPTYEFAVLRSFALVFLEWIIDAANLRCVHHDMPSAHAID